MDLNHKTTGVGVGVGIGVEIVRTKKPMPIPIPTPTPMVLGERFFSKKPVFSLPFLPLSPFMKQDYSLCAFLA